MFKKNLKHHGFVQYESIQYVDSENKWYAWYYIDIDKLKDKGDPEGEVNGN